MSPRASRLAFRVALWLALTPAVTHRLPAAVAADGFESLGIPVRVGGLMGCIVGPDGKGGESLYFNFNQISGLLFLVQVNPDTGEARQFNAPQGPGAWALVAGPDQRIYLGTWDGGLVLRFDPRQPDLGIQVVGKPSPTEDYIWQYALGTDGNLYGCTYPQAKLVRIDPRTDQMEDLGRMHPTEMYARSVAAGPDGWIYTGIGTTVGDLVAFNPATREQRSIMPPSLRGAPGWTTVGVSQRADGNAYAEFGTNFMRLEGGRAQIVSTGPGVAAKKLRDGRELVAFGRGTFSLKDPKTGTVVDHTFKYAGAGDHIFMLGVGPSNCVYGSTAMPLEVFRHDPRTRENTHLGNMPGGEVYSMMEEQGRLYLCYYGGAIMNLYDPGKPAWKFGTTPDCNPVSFGGVGDGHLRPRAMVRGPDGKFWVGSEPPYGELGGGLGKWDPALNRTVANFRHVVTNQSIVSLAFDPGTGLLFGGSGNYGGGGSKPVEKEALFFAFDPVAGKKVFETSLAAGAHNYPATCVAKGRVFTAAGDRLFRLDARSRELLGTTPLPGAQLDISLGTLPDGRLVGLTSKAVYVVDPDTGQIVHSAEKPGGIRCGFALIDRTVYFGTKAELWCYHLP